MYEAFIPFLLCIGLVGLTFFHFNHSRNWMKTPMQASLVGREEGAKEEPDEDYFVSRNCEICMN